MIDFAGRVWLAANIEKRGFLMFVVVSAPTGARDHCFYFYDEGVEPHAQTQILFMIVGGGLPDGTKHRAPSFVLWSERGVTHATPAHWFSTKSTHQFGEIPIKPAKAE